MISVVVALSITMLTDSGYLNTEFGKYLSINCCRPSLISECSNSGVPKVNKIIVIHNGQSDKKLFFVSNARNRSLARRLLNHFLTLSP
jgi:hypothetical protein